jgi:putative transposase
LCFNDRFAGVLFDHNMERRKVTFKLYPNAREAERLTAWVRAALRAITQPEQRVRKAGTSISYYDQQNVLRRSRRQAEFVELGSHALQQTCAGSTWRSKPSSDASRPDRRRDSPASRPARGSPGLLPDPAGWKLHQHGSRGGTLRLGSGKEAMTIRVRGQHRFGARPSPTT